MDDGAGITRRGLQEHADRVAGLITTPDGICTFSLVLVPATYDSSTDSIAPHGDAPVAASTTTKTGPVVTKLTATSTDVTTSALPAGTGGVTRLHPEVSRPPRSS